MAMGDFMSHSNTSDEFMCSSTGAFNQTTTPNSPFQESTTPTIESDPWADPVEEEAQSNLNDNCPLSYKTDTIAETDDILV
ncbi:uncharacterized protein BT62DRAFT_1014377 [Guyanagaster necrorhizus]|uniref:Uncharacterized protein n=1 Tax=Guyanagaster necrorhizus TaxID=856835 RepID=A0A9P7VFA8_9AGAR|nr:uncharacterized protein BT62DRAFT_1014377 [Guyanagaster necrorhizus MCA 3950]KAG7439106.1 hypothetical protein BT62DRAFT_1014377 [Guyanagaster necrorhizus MCA 3950]